MLLCLERTETSDWAAAAAASFIALHPLHPEQSRPQWGENELKQHQRHQIRPNLMIFFFFYNVLVPKTATTRSPKINLYCTCFFQEDDVPCRNCKSHFIAFLLKVVQRGPNKDERLLQGFYPSVLSLWSGTQLIHLRFGKNAQQNMICE